jgi:hypothetical protein
MFMLYGPIVGILAGLLLGGRLERLGRYGYRWIPLALVGLLVQVAIFSTPLGDAVDGLAPALYVASTAAVLLVVLRNVSLPRMGVPGLALVAAGAASNLLAVAANGGYMPADPGALASVGGSLGRAYTNSIVVADAALRPLTDVYALPAWLPLANVFSVGDALICAGIVLAVALGMRPGAPDTPSGRADA